MNFWVLMYLIFAPVFVLLVLVWFNRYVLLRHWWLYRHPETVYKAVFFFDNNMFVEKFVSSSCEQFKFRDGIYFIKKRAVLRRNWTGVFPINTVSVNKDNFVNFNDFKIWVDSQCIDRPSKAYLVGELHYVFGNPNPVLYGSGLDSLKGEFVVSVVGEGKSAMDMDRVEKNSVLDQLLTAEFKKNALFVIIILVIMVVGICGLLLALRMEWIEIPLHAVCVNIGGG